MSFGKYKVTHHKTDESVEVEAQSVSQALFRARNEKGWGYYGSLADGTYRNFTVQPLFGLNTRNAYGEEI